MLNIFRARQSFNIKCDWTNNIHIFLPSDIVFFGHMKYSIHSIYWRAEASVPKFCFMHFERYYTIHLKNCSYTAFLSLCEFQVILTTFTASGPSHSSPRLCGCSASLVWPDWRMSEARTRLRFRNTQENCSLLSRDNLALEDAGRSALQTAKWCAGRTALCII